MSKLNIKYNYTFEQPTSDNIAVEPYLEAYQGERLIASADGKTAIKSILRAAQGFFSRKMKEHNDFITFFPKDAENAGLLPITQTEVSVRYCKDGDNTPVALKDIRTIAREVASAISYEHPLTDANAEKCATFALNLWSNRNSQMALFLESYSDSTNALTEEQVEMVAQKRAQIAAEAKALKARMQAQIAKAK